MSQPGGTGRTEVSGRLAEPPREVPAANRSAQGFSSPEHALREGAGSPHLLKEFLSFSWHLNSIQSTFTQHSHDQRNLNFKIMFCTCSNRKSQQMAWKPNQE